MSVLLVLKIFTRDTNFTGSNSQDYAVLLFLQHTWNQKEKDIIHENLDNEHVIILQLVQMLMILEMILHRNIHTLMMRKIQIIPEHCKKTTEPTEFKWTKNLNDLNDLEDVDEDHLENNDQHLWQQKKKNLANKIYLTGRASISRLH